jgi:outer membrane protein TolC
MKKPQLTPYALVAAIAVTVALCPSEGLSQGFSPLAPEEEQAVAIGLQAEAPREEVAALPFESPGVVSAPPDGIGLDRLISIALERSPRLAVQRAKVGESRAQALGAGLLPNPEFEGGAKKVSGDGTGPVIGVNQELPINGVLGLQRRAAGFEYSAEQARLDREVQVVLADVERAFVAVLAAGRKVDVDARGLETASQSLQLVSDTFQAGLVSSLPLGLARSERANAKRTLALSEKNLQLERHGLALILGIEANDLPALSGDLNATLLDPAEVSAQANRPDLRAANLNLQAAQTNVQAAQRARIPNPVLGYAREESDQETEDFFKIGLVIPILNSGKAKVQQGLAQRQTASMEKSAVEKNVAIEIEQTSTRLEAARQAAQTYETEIRPANEESLAAAQGAFTSGTTDLSLLLTTQSKLIDNERGYVQALKELREAEIGYRLALGQVRY